MNTVITGEQRDLARAVRDACSAHAAKSGVRAMLDHPDTYEMSFWTLLSANMGLAGLVIPAEHGGAGGSWVDLMVVFEELGRAVAPAPALSTMVLAPAALLAADDEDARAEFLSRIAAGDLVATVAFTGLEPEPTLRAPGVTATASGSTVALTGRQDLVVDGCTAGLIIVPAVRDGEVSLYLVDAGADGLRRTRLEALDFSRETARLELDGTPARLIGRPGTGLEVLRRVREYASVAIAAEQVGGAQAAVDAAVAYAKQRVQFERAIGGFQAVKHKLVNLLQLVECARSSAHEAALAADSGTTELSVAAPMAKAFCSDAYVEVAKESLHVHGGIGFTWEHDAHLHLRKAKADEVLLGPPHMHREILAGRLLTAP